MGLLDRLGGSSRTTSDPAEAEVESSSPTSLSHQEALRDLPPTFSPNNFSNTPSSKLYNPYEGLSQAIGVKKHVFQLPEKTEFVFEEEAQVKRRGLTENTQFYTGLGYLSGATSGALWGSVRFLRTPPVVDHETLRLKANRLLNSAGSFARPMGHGLGILGLYFSLVEGYLNSQFDGTIPDTLISSSAGFVSGALFRSPRGLRQSVTAGVVGAVLGAGLAKLRTFVPSL